MKRVITGSAMLMVLHVGAALAQDKCTDPWENVSGTYKCEGTCNYTASVCSQPDYTVGVKRWRFTGNGVSATGILVVTGAKTIAFATKSGWDFHAASTTDCAATIKFDGTPGGTVWRRVSSGEGACGGGPRSRRR